MSLHTALARIELEYLSDMDRSNALVVRDVNYISTLQEDGVGGAFEKSLRVKGMIDELEALAGQLPSWKTLAALVRSEFRLWLMNEQTPLRQNPFLSHWVEAIQRLEKAAHVKDEAEAGAEEVSAQDIAATRLEMIKRMLISPVSAGNLTPGQVYETRFPGTPFDVQPYIRVLEEEGIYEPAPAPAVPIVEKESSTTSSEPDGRNKARSSYKVEEKSSTSVKQEPDVGVKGKSKLSIRDVRDGIEQGRISTQQERNSTNTTNDSINQERTTIQQKRDRIQQERDRTNQGPDSIQEPDSTQEPDSVKEERSDSPRLTFNEWRLNTLAIIATSPDLVKHQLTHLPLSLPALDFLTSLITTHLLPPSISPSEVILNFTQHALRLIEHMGQPPHPPSTPCPPVTDIGVAGDGAHGREAQTRALRLLVLFLGNLVRKGRVETGREGGRWSLYWDLEGLYRSYMWMGDVREFKGLIEGLGGGDGGEGERLSRGELCRGEV